MGAKNAALVPAALPYVQVRMHIFVVIGQCHDMNITVGSRFVFQSDSDLP